MASDPSFMNPLERGWFTPILWKSLPKLEQPHPHEWQPLRDRFAAARVGNFSALDDVLDIYHELRDPATRRFALSLLGAAGTDSQLEAVHAYVLDAVFDITGSCELCEALAVWGRLSAVEAILTIYDRHAPGQIAEGLPAYLTTMLESEFGAAADYPREDEVELYEAYEAGVHDLLRQRCDELHGPMAYALHGEEFAVRRLAERMLALLGSSHYEVMMQPFLRDRFEACTGLDCSDFYRNREFQPLTTAARLEAWLDSSAPANFKPGVRYFFGIPIPGQI